MTTLQINTHRIILEIGLWKRYLLHPSLSKASNWTITLLVERSRKKEKGNSPIHYPKSAKFPLTLVVNITNNFLTKPIHVFIWQGYKCLFSAPSMF